jgi:hypothetical protein
MVTDGDRPWPSRRLRSVRYADWCSVCYVMICQLCRRRIHRQRNGAWYHNHNASVSCRPGDGSGRKAVPLIEARAVSRGR